MTYGILLVSIPLLLLEGFFAAAGRYLQLLWLDAVGWPILALAVVGAALLGRRSWRQIFAPGYGRCRRLRTSCRRLPGK